MHKYTKILDRYISICSYICVGKLYILVCTCMYVCVYIYIHIKLIKYEFF